MTTELATRRPASEIMELVVAAGDLSKLSSEERLTYYNAVCESIGVNPLTRPFEYIVLNDRLELYARKDCTDQLRRIHKISRKIVGREMVDGVYTVTAQASMPDGDTDESVGAVPLVKEGGQWKTSQSGNRYLERDGTLIPLSPDERANAMMKAECVPLDSEILTRDGWKRYDALRVGEDVLAYDVAADECRWTPLQQVSVYPAVPVFRLSSTKGQFSVTCTPDHSWAVRRSLPYRPDLRGDGSRGARGPYDNRGPERSLTKACDIRTSHAIILAAGDRSEESLLNPTEAAILGWAVSDGTIKRVGNSVRLGICQSKERYFPRIRELVGSGVKELVSPGRSRTFPTGRTYDTKDQHWWYLTAAVSRTILEKCGFRDRADLPRIVTRLSATAREAMLGAMMDGDGDKRGVFANKDRHVLDAFQMLCALCGKATGQEKPKAGGEVNAIRLKKTRHVAGNFLSLQPAGTADVWCPTTLYGTWVMRQGGRVTITGNTKAKRRVTLSICGLGFLDESELETVAGLGAGPQRQQSPEQEFQVTEDGEPDLTHAPTRAGEWRKAAKERAVDAARAVSFIEAATKKHSPDSDGLAWQQDKLARFVKGDFDEFFRGGKKNGAAEKEQPAAQQQMAAETPAAATQGPTASPPAPQQQQEAPISPPPPAEVTDADVEPWTAFYMNAHKEARSQDVSDTDFNGGLKKALANVGKKQETVSREMRRKWLKAMRAGEFNWLAGRIEQVQQQPQPAAT